MDWGIATEEGAVRIVTAIGKQARPWFAPTVRRCLLLPTDWRILTITLLGSGVAFLVALSVYGVSGELKPPISMVFIILSAVIGMTNGLMWQKLQKEGLTPWSKCR